MLPGPLEVTHAPLRIVLRRRRAVHLLRLLFQRLFMRSERRLIALGNRGSAFICLGHELLLCFDLGLLENGAKVVPRRLNDKFPVSSRGAATANSQGRKPARAPGYWLSPLRG